MDPFLGEIRAVPYNFAPYLWADCDGQLLPIQQYTALFSLLGTFYGGDGRSTFALPNFQGCVAIGQGQGPGLSDVVLGETGGVAAVELTASQIPAHSHDVHASSATATTGNPSGAVLAVPAVAPRLQHLYHATSNGATEDGSAVQPNGGNQPHENMQPYLTMRYVIAMNGVYPPRG